MVQRRLQHCGSGVLCPPSIYLSTLIPQPRVCPQPRSPPRPGSMPCQGLKCCYLLEGNSNSKCRCPHPVPALHALCWQSVGSSLHTSAGEETALAGGHGMSPNPSAKWFRLASACWPLSLKHKPHTLNVKTNAVVLCGGSQISRHLKEKL